MIVEPKIRGFICTTAHPTGCEAFVNAQIEYVKSQAPIDGPKRVLIIGASTGYGLASRIAATYGANAQTIGVFFERGAAGKRTATAGWYNSAAFEKAAHGDGYYAKSINADAFQNETKQNVIELIKKDWPEGVDLIIYSLAAPRRTHPDTNQTYQSTLKPIGQAYHNKTININTGEVSDIVLEPAQPEEIDATCKVMGGEDWQMWIDALLEANVLSPRAKTIAYSYIGPDITHAIYRAGTIGKAKEDLESTAQHLSQKLSEKCQGEAMVSINKGLVTQASSAIPVVPLYISLLYKIMKAQNIHEGCIEQIHRLFHDHIYNANPKPRDDKGRIRIDDLELQQTVQDEINAVWDEINTDNIHDMSDLVGYQQDFYQLFGFKVDNVDYQSDVDIDVQIPSISS